MSFISKILGNKDEEFTEVRVDREVLESVIYYSKKAYPNEFLAFFDGQIKDKILYITSLLFVPGETCETGAVVHTELIPMNTKYMGSVHSHPGPSARPSDADLRTFSKNGYFHMIVCLPYSMETLNHMTDTVSQWIIHWGITPRSIKPTLKTFLMKAMS